ncbi:L,D-transpeptidase [Clostridium sp. DJ247]|nr:L,D-transpeptidase [Clostridium sp. DJ247]
MNLKGNIMEDEKSKIGFPASHGCIRISIQDAEWIYKIFLKVHQ